MYVHSTVWADMVYWTAASCCC